MDPKNALERLIEGNRRYAKEASEHPNRDTESRRATAVGQYPFAVIVGCSDSRVPAEILFDQGIGDLFVVRVAGGVVGPIEMASISFAVEQLGVCLIFVLGHERCGAVDAVLSNKGHLIEPITDHILPAIEGHTQLEQAVKANVHHVAEKLKTSFSHNGVSVASGYYCLESGIVELLA